MGTKTSLVKYISTYTLSHSIFQRLQPVNVHRLVEEHRLKKKHGELLEYPMTDPWDERYIYWKVRCFFLFYSWIIWEGIGQPEFFPPVQTNLTRNWVLQKNRGWDTRESWVMLGMQAVRFVGMLVCNHVIMGISWLL